MTLQELRQAAFNAVWNEKRRDGFSKTSAWNDPGMPFEGNGCLCCIRALSTNATSDEYFSLSYMERHMLTCCHADARSAAEMEAGLRRIAVAWGVNVPDGDDGFSAFMAKVQAPLHEEPKVAPRVVAS